MSEARDGGNGWQEGDSSEMPRRLKVEFSYDKAMFTQLHRTENQALYRRNPSDHLAPPSFELINIQIAQPAEFSGIRYPTRERYPRSEEWGIHAWTYSSLADVAKSTRTSCEIRRFCDEAVSRHREEAKTSQAQVCESITSGLLGQEGGLP